MPQIQQMQQQQYYAMPQYQMYQQQQAMQQQNAMVVDEYNARQQVKGHDNQMQQQYNTQHINQCDAVNSNTIISHINYDMQQPNEETECNISPLMRWCIDNKFETYHDTLFYLCQLESPHEFKDLKENDLNDIAEQYLGLKFAKKNQFIQAIKDYVKMHSFQQPQQAQHNQYVTPQSQDDHCSNNHNNEYRNNFIPDADSNSCSNNYGGYHNGYHSENQRHNPTINWNK
eukprot:202695_1